MDSDAYVFFTRCHRLYVQGMRRAIQERLQSAFGDDWWMKGVEHALTGEQRDNLRFEIARNPDRDRRLSLDAAHFPSIISKHDSKVFSDAFTDALRAFRETRSITALRNEWAHAQDISATRSKRASELMKSILASLGCEEALEVERMSRGFMPAGGSYLPQDSVDELDGSDGTHDLGLPTVDPWIFWRHLQSYLVLEQSIELPKDDSAETARIVVKVHNTAPESKDWPTVHFESVTVSSSGGQSAELEELGPGETGEAEFSFQTKQLVAVELNVTGTIDIGRLFRFTRMMPLPDVILTPLKEEFLARLESIAIKEFVNDVLEEIGTLDTSTTLAKIAQVRNALHHQSEQTGVKRTALAALSDELGGGSTLGRRTREITKALAEFEKKLHSLNKAISSTDVEPMNEAISDLKQAQLAVLRVEDTIRTMTAGTPNPGRLAE